MSGPSKLNNVNVRLLDRDELVEADRILRLAFGTYLGLPDPAEFMGDGDYVRTRWAADPSLALAAEVDGKLVGTNFVTCWGSAGFFGPLSVDPSLWDRGVARALLDETVPLLEDRGVRHRGLYTFGQSPKHLSLYQRYGFLPRFLTAICAKPVTGQGSRDRWTTASALPAPSDARAEAGEITSSVLEGLDVSREIDVVRDQKLGDTVLVYDGGALASFGVCHVGPGSEAGSGNCYVKFAAARPGAGAPQRFARLLDACEGFAASSGATAIIGGVSTGRRGAYGQMLSRGYRAVAVGVTMHHPDEPAYHHRDAYVIDDWR